MTDEIWRALTAAHPEDLATVRQYVQWVAIRRQVHDHFYLRGYIQAHWVQGMYRAAHWI